MDAPLLKTVRTQEIFQQIKSQRFTIMGIVNVTPDSFYDGGKFFKSSQAEDHALDLIDQGADIIDIGGESTRPGSGGVSVEEQLNRVLPVIEKVRTRSSIPISIDTRNSRVAYQALKAGADIVNDVSAGRYDSLMPDVISEFQCGIILMHSRKDPSTMQEYPMYHDVGNEVQEELLHAVEFFLEKGVNKDHIILDPGIGFAKRLQDNISLLHQIRDIVDLGYEVVVGTSRKSFIGHLTNATPENRLPGSLASVVRPFFDGVRIFRVHDVKETKDFLTVLSCIDKR